MQGFGLMIEELDAGAVRIALRGELDLAHAYTFDEELRRVEEARPPTVVVDLRELTFLDSCGLARLLAARRRARRAGHQLLLVRGPATFSACSRCRPSTRRSRWSPTCRWRSRHGSQRSPAGRDDQLVGVGPRASAPRGTRRRARSRPGRRSRSGALPAIIAAVFGRVDRRVDDQQRDVHAAFALLLGRGVDQRAGRGRARRPQPAIGHRPPRAAAGDLDQRRRAGAHALARGTRTPARRPRRSSRGSPRRSRRASAPPPNGPGLVGRAAETALTITSMPPNSFCAFSSAARSDVRIGRRRPTAAARRRADGLQRLRRLRDGRAAPAGVPDDARGSRRRDCGRRARRSKASAPIVALGTARPRFRPPRAARRTRPARSRARPGTARRAPARRTG